MAGLQLVYGIGSGGTLLMLPPPIQFENPPIASQDNYPIGQLVFTGTAGAYTFYIYAGAGVWDTLETSNVAVTSVTGTANQVLATPTTGDVVVSLVGPYTPATYTAHGVLVGEGTGSIVATATGSAGQFLVSNGSSADPTFQTATPQLVVTPVAGATQAMISNHTYIANDASKTTFTLPTTSSVGDILGIVGSQLNTGGWAITYTTGQIIYGPNEASTITTGNLTSTAAFGQAVEIICTVANTSWVVKNNSGTYTVT